MMWPACWGPKVHLRTAPVGLSSWWGLPFHGVSSRVARTSARWGSASAGSAVIWSDTVASGMMRYTPLAAESLLDQGLQVDGVGVGVVTGALDLLGLGQHPVGGAGVKEFEMGGVAPLGQQLV